MWIAISRGVTVGSQVRPDLSARSAIASTCERTPASRSQAATLDSLKRMNTPSPKVSLAGSQGCSLSRDGLIRWISESGCVGSAPGGWRRLKPVRALISLRRGANVTD